MSKRIPIIIGLLLTVLSLWLLISPNPTTSQMMERLEKIVYDVQLRARILAHPYEIKTPIAIIDIDDKSLAAEGRWPWPRQKLGLLVDKLKEADAAVVAFDIFFSEAQANILTEVMKALNEKKMSSPFLNSELANKQKFFDQDTLFAKSIAKMPVVLAATFIPNRYTQNTLTHPLLTLDDKNAKELEITTSAGYISNIPVLQTNSSEGFINIFPDLDGIIRNVPLIIRYQNQVYPSLALEAVLLFLKSEVTLVVKNYNGINTLEGIKFANRTVPTDAYGKVIIPFIGRSYSFPFYSATDVLQGNVPKENLAGKILFVGTSASGLGDLVPTAIQNPFPGVEIQATIANALLLNDFYYEPAWIYGAVVCITFFAGLIASIIFPYFGPQLLGATIIFLPVIVILLNDWIWRTTGLIIPLLLPIILIVFIAILNLLYGYFFESRRREKIKQMFGQYVPEKHIDAMLTSSDNYALKGEDREMSVLFADIRDFTSISEKMTAAELVSMLNTFFTPMTEIIFKNKGTIDKYVGDLIMAFWGAPLHDTEHASHALSSALGMQRKLSTLQNEMTDWPPIHIGIGVNSGIMSVGDMGSQYRKNYTVLGDAVNLASRIESLTKYYGVNIMTTEFTIQNEKIFIFKLIDLVRVKGKKKGIKIYEVLGYQTEMTEELKIELAQYHQAIEFYLQKKWQDAKKILQQLNRDHQSVVIYQIYLNRIEEFMKNPPPDDWDGTFVHTSK